MLARLRHREALQDACCAFDAIKRPSNDPTGTAPIRSRYKTLLAIRWRRLTNQVKSAVIAQDMLGLKPDNPTALSLALSTLPPDARQKAFQTWFDAALNRVVLDGDAAYLDPMIEKAYAQGVARAQRMSKKVVPPDAMGTVHNLQQLVLTEMQGIAEAVSQRTVRLAAQAMLDNVDARKTFQLMKQTIEQIGITRSNQMVSVMVVKAHGTAVLDTLEQAGVRRVGVVPEKVKPVQSRALHSDTGPGLTDETRDARARGPGSRSSRAEPPSRSTVGRISRAERALEEAFNSENVEVLTAGDDIVCPECEDISADGPYTIDEARSLIPAHPECRCTFVTEDEFAQLA